MGDLLSCVSLPLSVAHSSVWPLRWTQQGLCLRRWMVFSVHCFSWRALPEPCDQLYIIYSWGNMNIWAFSRNCTFAGFLISQAILPSFCFACGRDAGSAVRDTLILCLCLETVLCVCCLLQGRTSHTVGKKCESRVTEAHFMAWSQRENVLCHDPFFTPTINGAQA